MHLEAYQNIPKEFQVTELKKPESPRAVATDLGFVAARNAIVLPRSIYSEAA